MYTCTCVYVQYVCMYVRICMCVYMYMYNVRTCVCVRACVCVYTVRKCTCVCVCVYGDFILLQNKLLRESLSRPQSPVFSPFMKKKTVAIMAVCCIILVFSPMR